MRTTVQLTRHQPPVSVDLPSSSVTTTSVYPVCGHVMALRTVILMVRMNQENTVVLVVTWLRHVSRVLNTRVVLDNVYYTRKSIIKLIKINSYPYS